ncbi:aminotransferase class I/II-fold pyridoxal phosphate-dependent enzyme [Prochlorococcus marinus]|uniref:methionine gamma-lyase family protein n=1 Tax=Prochlorococcus marinus TaxID=1219 RepID=UPI0022B4A303|nr:aminotransferase class I/II-fold pyridoxal phosphate-dependent enzyme [Prochlorococcus marinus]
MKNINPTNDFLHKSVFNLVSSVEDGLKQIIDRRTKGVQIRLEKVLKAFSDQGLGPQHFSSVSGYGHGDLGRELIDNVYASVFGAEKAAVRMQFVSGTHAIASALFGVLRPGDNLLSITGKPYDTLEEVIGIRGKNHGSLIDFGIKYDEISIFNGENIDFKSLELALQSSRKMIFIQRSSGYSWRPSLSIKNIEEICKLIHFKQPNCICFVDNCYGEFVEEKEPSEVGADIIAGSLIKNPGGTIVPSGGYIAGQDHLVEKACCRLTAPGIGSKGGTGFDLNRLVLQGLFLSPQMVAEALIGSDIIAGVFQKLGFEVQPLPGKFRGDLIQTICLGNAKALKLVCKSFQLASPVSSYLNPIPASTPGYENDLIMAGGTFIDGSTSEFSADAPLLPPYNLFVQGGTHRAHVKIAIIQAVIALVQEQIVDLPKI